MSKHKFIPNICKTYPKITDDEHLSIQPSNSKLGKIANISLVPQRDCPNHKECFAKCYANKFYKMYPSTNLAWDKNSRIFRQDKLRAREDLINFLVNYKGDLFRIHVAGDFITNEQFWIWTMIASDFPNITFKAFTKNYELINRNKHFIPANLKIRFSVWSTMETLPTGMPLAFVQDGNETRQGNAFNCPAVKNHKIKCDTCRHCWDKDGDVIFDIH